MRKPWWGGGGEKADQGKKYTSAHCLARPLGSRSQLYPSSRSDNIHLVLTLMYMDMVHM